MGKSNPRPPTTHCSFWLFFLLLLSLPPTAALPHLLDAIAHRANTPFFAKATKAGGQKQLCTKWKRQLGLLIGERGIQPFVTVALETSQKQKQALHRFSFCFFLISFAVVDKTLKSNKMHGGLCKKARESAIIEEQCVPMCALRLGFFSLSMAAKRAGALSSEH